jgi:anti-sigma factor RsiW
VTRRDDELMRYFDGDLDDAEARRLEQALAGSPLDRARLEALGEIRTLLRESSQRDAATAPSEAMWASIRGELARGRRPALGERLAVAWSDLWAGPARYWVPATAAAGAVALAFALTRPAAPAALARDVVIESVETAGVTATVFQIPDDTGGDGIAVLWITPESEGDEE